MWLDLIALGLLAYFIVKGFRSGTWVSLLRIVSVVGAYAAAFLLGPVLAPVLVLALGLGDLAALIAASSGLFAVVFVSLGLVGSGLKRARARREESVAPSALDQLGGAFFGALQGAIFALLLGVLASWVEVGQAKGAMGSLPTTKQPTIARASRAVIENTAQAVLDEGDATALAAVRFAVRPKESLQGVDTLLHSPAIRRLQNDRLFWSYLENGAVDSALNTGAFLAITRDPELRQQFANLGTVSPESADDSGLFRREVRELLVQAAPRIRQVRNDPELAELARDPEIVAALEQGAIVDLLSHPRFRALVSRLLAPVEDPAADPNAAAVPAL